MSEATRTALCSVTFTDDGASFSGFSRNGVTRTEIVKVEDTSREGASRKALLLFKDKLYYGDIRSSFIEWVD